MFFAFTPIYDTKAFPWRNRVVPQSIFFILKLIFLYLPIVKGLIYLIYWWRSALVSQIAGPWLLACTANCIFILGVWYWTHILAVVESYESTLEQEYKWEAERL